METLIPKRAHEIQFLNNYHRKAFGLLRHKSSNYVSQVKGAFRDELSRLEFIQKRNIKTLQDRPWKEISGAFGDLGLYIPLFVALSDRHHSQISAASTLTFDGIFNILTGLYFGIPLPVQPMKTIAAMAISDTEHYTVERVASAGLFVAGGFLLLCITGTLGRFANAIPVPVVKGIQIGTGLKLVMCAFDLLPPLNMTVKEAWPQFWHDIAALLGTLFLLFCATRPQLPFVLLSITGLTVLAAFCMIVLFIRYSLQPGLYFHLWEPTPLVLNGNDFIFGAFNAGLGQLPLTTLNSIVAVTAIAEDLYPEVLAPSAIELAYSCAFMNLLGSWFGAMPVCHGPGGLTAQHRFGARSGSSVIILGTIKLLLGLLASQFAMDLCGEVFDQLLAVMLFLAGLELVRQGETLNTEKARDLWEDITPQDNHFERRRFKPLTDDEKLRRYMIMLVTVSAILGAKNQGVGVIAGLCTHYGYQTSDWFAMKRKQLQIARKPRKRQQRPPTDVAIQEGLDPTYADDPLPMGNPPS